MDTRSLPSRAIKPISETQGGSCSRREFLAISGAMVRAAGLACTAAALPFAAPGFARAEKTGDRAKGAAQASLPLFEEKTKLLLSGIEAGLEKALAKGETFEQELHSLLIRLSMWGPLAGLNQRALFYLGDNPETLRSIPGAEGLVRWMSGPYLFPAETAGDAKTQGKELDKVFKFISQQNGLGFQVTLDNVGDASLSSKDARAYNDYYLHLISHFCKAPGPGELFVSLKLSALTYELELALKQGEKAKAKRLEIKEALTELLLAASNAPNGKRVFIRIDMEEYDFKDLTLELFRQVVEENPGAAASSEGSLRMGVVIQAYLRDSAQDLHDLGEWAKGLGVRAPVRLVKGAYLTHENSLARQQGRISPVWGHKPSTDANFELLSAYMLLKPEIFDSAFATHNIRSMAHAMALAQGLNLPRQSCEFQMLRGMGDAIKSVVASMGYVMRVYVPAGSLARGLKYAGRRFSELASEDNALARTMRGDFAAVNQGVPGFIGPQDILDSKYPIELVRSALGRPTSSPGKALRL